MGEALKIRGATVEAVMKVTRPSRTRMGGRQVVRETIKMPWLDRDLGKFAQIFETFKFYR